MPHGGLFSRSTKSKRQINATLTRIALNPDPHGLWLEAAKSSMAASVDAGVMCVQGAGFARLMHTPVHTRQVAARLGGAYLCAGDQACPYSSWSGVWETLICPLPSAFMT